MKRLELILQSNLGRTGARIEIKSQIDKVIRKIIIVISFLVSLCNGFAQNMYADSVRKLLQVAKDDESKVLLLSQLSYYIRYTNMDSSLYYGRSAVSLAQKLKYFRGEAYALSDLGIDFRDKGELSRALELEFRALEIASKYDYLLVESNALRRIGLLNFDLNRYPKAIDYCQKALNIDQQIGNNRGIAFDYLVTAQAFIDLKDSSLAWYFIQKSGEKITSIEDYRADFLIWRGNAFWLKRNKDSALAVWKEGLRLGLSLDYYRTTSLICYYIGTMYRELKNPDSSITYAKQGLEYAKKASNGKEILMSSKLLFNLYDSLNQPVEALRYSKIAAAAKDSLLGPGNIQAIEELIASQNERQAEVEAERARLNQIVLATGMGAILIIAFILYRNNRKKQKTNLTLAKQKAEIQEALTKLKSTQTQLVQAEKMASLGELTAGIAHEIQNPLNFVNNFSEVNTELLAEMRDQIEKGNLEEVKRISGDIEANEHKILHHGGRADAIVKNMIQHARGAVGHKEPTNINNLTEEYLRLAYHAVRAKDKSFHAEIKTLFDDTIDKIEIIPQDIGRVFVNLYNNAFYAVGEKMNQSLNGYEANITVTTRKVNGMVEISVKDNGTGMPEKIRQKIFQPFFTTKPVGQGTGLGLSLSYDIIKAHGGDIKMESKEGMGSEFIIQLPAKVI
jgi:signal transduction histidine kinase